MTNNRALCPQRALYDLWIFFSVAQLLSTTALPQPTSIQAAAGAVGVAGVMRKEMSMHSKTALGMGEAMIHRSYSSEEDPDDYRRKRAIAGDEDLAAGGPRTSFTKLMRNLNAPCHGGGGGGGTTGGGDTGAADGGDDIVDEARRRMARMRARKAAAAKKKKNTKAKKKQSGRRRRRQIEVDDIEDLSESKRAEFENEFRAHIQDFTEKMNRVYEHISASVMEMMQRMQGHFYDGANGES